MIRDLRRVIRAYPTMLRVGLAEALAYRAEMLIWMLTTLMPLVSLALWAAVSADAPMGRFTPRTFSAYFLVTLLVRQLTGSWLVWELNSEIKTGSLARRLLRPVHPLVAYSAENLGAVPLRAAISAPIAAVAIYAIDKGSLPREPIVIFAAFASLVGAWLINFFVMAIIGSLAFFIESSVKIFELWLIAFMLLSGYTVPLELFPPSLRSIAEALPFRYSLGLSVELFLGHHDARSALRELAAQWAYVAGAAVTAIVAFRVGLRRYASFGG